MRGGTLTSAFQKLGAGLFVLSAGLVGAACAIAHPGSEALSNITPCATAEDCPGRFVCLNKECAVCSCPAGQSCIADTGQCVNGPGCPIDCPAGMFCSVSGKCINEGSCHGDVDCQGGYACDTSAYECVSGGPCAGAEINTAKLSPNLMIMFDRTGSTANLMPNSNKTRLEAETQAAKSLLAAFEGQIRFGATLFSACLSGGCSAGTIINPLGSSVADIEASMDAAFACQSNNPETSIGATLKQFIGYAPLSGPGRDNALLMVTDGEDNCMGGPVAAAAALAAQAVPVRVYAIGLGGDVNIVELGKIAQAAGTAPYMQANSEEQLYAAMEKVAKKLKSCAFELSKAPSTSDIHVFFNNNPAGIPEGGPDGWTIDLKNNSIVFSGQACDEVLAGNVIDLDVVDGCALPTEG